jgi:endonuclease G
MVAIMVSQIGAQGLEAGSLPWSQCPIILKHTHYKVCYQNEGKIAVFTAHLLNRRLMSGNTKRTNNYRSNPQLTNPVGSGDYARTGFDRGHLVPAADMKINRQAMSETFFMSNMAPQRPGFNRGVWQSIEKAVRRAIQKNGEALVITAPVLRPGLPQLASKVAIPEWFYKILYWPQQKVAIGFLIQNKGHSGQNYRDFQVTVDEIEAMTGLDFFSQLPDNLEDAMESELVELNF